MYLKAVVLSTSQLFPGDERSNELVNPNPQDGPLDVAATPTLEPGPEQLSPTTSGGEDNYEPPAVESPVRSATVSPNTDEPGILWLFNCCILPQVTVTVCM